MNLNQLLKSLNLFKELFMKISIIIQLTMYATMHKLTQSAHPFIIDFVFALSAS